MQEFRKWLDEFLWEKIDESQEVYRVKGLLCVHGSESKFILQAVHELYDIFEGKKWGDTEKKQSKLVFIGKNLNEENIRNALKCCQGIV
jgi:G3E family GTPase